MNDETNQAGFTIIMKLSMKLLPPSPVTATVPLDVRLAAESEAALDFRITVCRDGEVFAVRHTAGRPVSGGTWQSGTIKLDFSDHPGRYRILAEAVSPAGKSFGSAETVLDVLDTPTRSSGLIDGAWCGLYHWSEQEGRLWNPELRRFTAEDWTGLVYDMHRAGLNVIILQELFRNQDYYGKHHIGRQGYAGKAFYPSALFPGRMPVACADPVEAIMAAADECGMAVLPGVGMYAWFDFTAGSLDWHRQIAAELWQRYGHHRSFYGWYISEEVFGNLHYGKNTAEEIVTFFREFREWKNRFDPTLPVMLAPNCFGVPAARAHWEKLAAELDIICPFGFHRMPPEDIGPEKAIALFQEIADANGAHLWLDMEIFLFTDDQALYPRPLEQIIGELACFTGFEKILCYQYPGLMNAPDARLQPGGASTVKLYGDYLNYYESRIKQIYNNQ